MTKLTKPQRRKLFKVWRRSGRGISYLAFRRAVSPMLGDGAIICLWVQGRRRLELPSSTKVSRIWA
jgi:hypothetical protein